MYLGHLQAARSIAADHARASPHTWIYAVLIRRPADTVGSADTAMEAVTACNDLI